MTEYFDVVDEDDNVIGRATRKECHSNNKLIHRGVHIFVFNSKGEILLEKRSMKKDLYPGVWGDVAGHVDSGETYEEAAKRELKEEIGVEAELKRVCDFKKYTEIERENNRIFECKSDGPFKMQKDEVDSIQFFSIDKIKKMIDETPESFTPGTVVALKKYFEKKQ
ncbi:NUDIX domain-containing protein [Candidatus Aenigmatarchaeota archaeon]